MAPLQLTNKQHKVQVGSLNSAFSPASMPGSSHFFPVVFYSLEVHATLPHFFPEQHRSSRSPQRGIVLSDSGWKSKVPTPWTAVTLTLIPQPCHQSCAMHEKAFVACRAKAKKWEREQLHPWFFQPAATACKGKGECALHAPCFSWCRCSSASGPSLSSVNGHKAISPSPAPSSLVLTNPLFLTAIPGKLHQQGPGRCFAWSAL